MRKLNLLLLTIAAFLTACGSSDDTLSGGLGPGGQPVANIGSLTLLTSSPQIPSDGANDATITALVRDSNNNVMESVPVVFTADSGSLVVTQPAITDPGGQLTATLSTATSSCRQVTVGVDRPLATVIPIPAKETVIATIIAAKRPLWIARSLRFIGWLSPLGD